MGEIQECWVETALLHCHCSEKTGSQADSLELLCQGDMVGSWKHMANCHVCQCWVPLSLGEASAERTWCWQAGWDSCDGDDDFHTLHSGGCDTGEGGKSAGGAIEAGEAREDSQPEVGRFLLRDRMMLRF